MNMTNHANIRSQQRGFSPFIIEIILQCGNPSEALGGATKICLGNKEHQRTVSELKKVIQVLDKAKGGNIIISGDNIITAYK